MTISPMGIAIHRTVVDVMIARVTRQMRKPSRNDLRMPTASTSEPTSSVASVMSVDQIATVSPAAAILAFRPART
jgi:hypothetical protein